MSTDPYCPPTSDEAYNPFNTPSAYDYDSTGTGSQTPTPQQMEQRGQIAEQMYERMTYLNNAVVSLQQKVIDKQCQCCYSSETQTADLIGKIVLPMIDRMTAFENAYLGICDQCLQHFLRRFSPLLEQTYHYVSEYGDIDEVIELAPKGAKEEPNTVLPEEEPLPQIELGLAPKIPRIRAEQPLKDLPELIGDELPRGHIPVPVPRIGGLGGVIPKLPEKKCPDCCIDFTLVNAIFQSIPISIAWQNIIRFLRLPKPKDKDKEEYGKVEIPLPSLKGLGAGLEDLDSATLKQTSQTPFDTAEYGLPNEELEYGTTEE